MVHILAVGQRKVKNLLSMLLGALVHFSCTGIFKFKFFEVFLKHDP